MGTGGRYSAGVHPVLPSVVVPSDDRLHLLQVRGEPAAPKPDRLGHDVGLFVAVSHHRLQMSRARDIRQHLPVNQ